MLTIRELVKVYPGPVAALQGVDLDIPKGMFGLLGPNGAGKTTLMRIVAGLLEPTSGKITLDGQDLTGHPELLWPHLGYLPQEFGFLPHLTCEQMLMYLLKLKGVRSPGGLKNLCAQLLEQVNLTFAAKRKVKGYSGGMKQRLGIAQAIAGDPKLLIVDEPTAGLDPEERLRFYGLLSKLATDRTVILSTHIVEDVSQLCNSFAIIRGGKLLTVTTPSDVQKTLEGTIYEGSIAVESYDSFRQTYCVTQSYFVGGKQKARIFTRDGSAPDGFRPVPQTLEDGYFVYMRGDDPFLTEMPDAHNQAEANGVEATR